MHQPSQDLQQLRSPTHPRIYQRQPDSKNDPPSHRPQQSPHLPATNDLILNAFTPLEARLVYSNLGDVFLIIWWVPKPKQIIHPTRYIDHRPPMCKSVEAIATVVCTSAGITDATEGRVWDAGVGHYVVDCHASGIGLREDCSGC